MKIVFVMGLGGAGKSTYIKEHFKDYTVIDLWNYQSNRMTVEDCWKSYMDCKDDLIKAIQNNEDVVLEHTLYKAERRKIYIDAVREVTNEPIEIIHIDPPKHILKQRWFERNLCEEYNFESRLKFHLEVLEEPQMEEGFSKITTIH